MDHKTSYQQAKTNKCKIKKVKTDKQLIYEYVRTNFAVNTDVNHVSTVINLLVYQKTLTMKSTKHEDLYFIVNENTKDLTLSVPKRLKNLIFEIPKIPQTLSINN